MQLQSSRNKVLEGKNCTLSRLNGRQVGKPETHHMPGTPPSIPGPAAEGAVGHNCHPGEGTVEGRILAVDSHLLDSPAADSLAAGDTVLVDNRT